MLKHNAEEKVEYEMGWGNSRHRDVISTPPLPPPLRSSSSFFFCRKIRKLRTRDRVVRARTIRVYVIGARVKCRTPWV